MGASLAITGFVDATKAAPLMAPRRSKTMFAERVRAKSKGRR